MGRDHDQQLVSVPGQFWWHALRGIGATVAQRRFERLPEPPAGVGRVLVANGAYVLVDADLEAVLRRWRWQMKNQGKGYAWRTDSKNDPKVLMHRYVLGIQSRQHVHHDNGNTLDNRRENLEPMSAQEHRQLHKYDIRRSNRIPTGSLVITSNRSGQPFFEGKFRWEGRQYKRRLGSAWLIPNGAGWTKRPGRAPEGFLDRPDALVALRDMIQAHAAENTVSNNVEHSFGQVAEHWYARAVRRQRKPSTLFSYRQAIDVYILGKRASAKITKPCPFAHKPMADVSKQDMRLWFDRMPHSRSKEKLHKIIKGICEYAVSEDLAASNVAKAVDCREMPYDDYEFFDHAQIARLIAAAEHELDAALYATAAMTGLRKGELFALRWADIDFAHSRLVVRRNLTLNQIVTPKNGKSRVVPLVPDLAARLKLLKRRGLHRPNAYVFSNPEASLRRYRAAVKRAGLPRLPFHSLRHAFASHAVNVATLVQVRQWCGHSDLRTTGRYLHAKHLDSDAELLALAFSA